MQFSLYVSRTQSSISEFNLVFGDLESSKLVKRLYVDMNVYDIDLSIDAPK